MKASQIIKALCDTWEKDLPAQLKAAEAGAADAQRNRSHDPEAYHKAHAELTRAKGALGRVRALRTTLDSFIREFGDTEVPLK